MKIRQGKGTFHEDEKHLWNDYENRGGQRNRRGRHVRRSRVDAWEKTAPENSGRIIFDFSGVIPADVLRKEVR